ncbi:hypothetical protein BH10PSE19_BH10PSE19_22300 [soil metagenome]
MHAYPLNGHAEPTSADKKRILTKALIRMAERFELSRRELSAIIGQSESSLSRIFTKQNYYIDPASKEGQLAILLLRLFRNLDTLFGGNANQCQLWLKSDNSHLNAKPLELIQSIEGLIITIHYLDAIRGKN